MRRPPDNPGSSREAWSAPTARVDWLAGPIDNGNSLRCPLATFLVDHRPGTADAGFSRAGYTDWHTDEHGTKIGRKIQTVVQGGFPVLEKVERTYLVMKGTGLTAARTRGLDDAAVLALFADWSGSCRRIDLAVDVLHSDISPRAVYDLHSKGRMQTAIKQHEWICSPKGSTFYLRGTDLVVRVYDKSAERARKGHLLPRGVTRFELELRGNLAERAFAMLHGLDRAAWSQAFPEAVCGIILSKMRPLDGPCPKHQRHRVPTWPPLAEAFAQVGPVRLPRDEQLRTAQAALQGRATYVRNAKQAIAFIREVCGEETWRDVLASIGGATLSPEDLAMVEMLRQNPDTLQAILRNSGLMSPTLQEVPDASLN